MVGKGKLFCKFKEAYLEIGAESDLGYKSEGWEPNNDKAVVATTTVDLSKWTQGATMTITKNDDQNTILRVKNPNGDIIAGSATSYCERATTISYTLSKEAIATCKSGNSYQFTFEYQGYSNPIVLTEIKLSMIE